jgi:glycosyltransferase involved in cell wall biosynthesis
VTEARRILFVIGGLGTGGAERQLLELACGLDREQFEPLVCALEAGYEFSAAFAQRGIPVRELPRKGPWDWSRLAGLRALVREVRPALIHAFLASPALYARLATVRLPEPMPVVVSERTVLPYAGYVRIAAWLLAHRCDCFVANAEAVRASLLRWVWPQRPRVEVIPNGFDVDAIASGRPRREMRDALGWGDETVLLCVGRLTDAKDFPTLLSAFERLRGRPGLRLAIAGEGSERGRIEREVQQRGLRVTLLGLRKDVPDLLRAADLFVLSSKVEGFPNVLGEALAAELPVAATAAGGVPEVVRDGLDGRVVPVGDAAGLADAIAELLDDPEHAREMARTGARRVRAEFSLEAMVERTQQLYRSLLDARSR